MSEAPENDGGPDGSRLTAQVVDDCAAKTGAVEDYPFGDGVAVFKVAGRMFALVSLGPPPGAVSLKCDPGLAVELRDRHAAITPATT